MDKTPEELAAEEEAAKKLAAEQTVSTKVVDDLVSTFKDSMKAMAAAQPAPVAPVPVDPNIAREASVQAQSAALEKYQAACAEGNYSEGLGEYVQFMQAQAASAPQQPAQDNPQFQGMVKQAERLARIKHEDTFEKYGPEVAAEVASMDPAKQLNPDSWDEAIGTIRTRHFDEILDETIKARDAKAQAPASPQNTPGTGITDPENATSANDLDSNALGVCKSFRVTPEAYAKQKDDIAKLGGKTGAIPLFSEDTNAAVKPGRF